MKLSMSCGTILRRLPSEGSDLTLCKIRQVGGSCAIDLPEMMLPPSPYVHEIILEGDAHELPLFSSQTI
jgi:hypothetical protein